MPLPGAGGSCRSEARDGTTSSGAQPPIRSKLSRSQHDIDVLESCPRFSFSANPDIVAIGGTGDLGMPEWPKEKLLKHGPELPMEERIRRYQENIRTIRASGCTVPTSAMVDSLDPAVIELWFADNAFSIDRIRKLTATIAELPDDTAFPSPLIPIAKGE